MSSPLFARQSIKYKNVVMMLLPLRGGASLGTVQMHSLSVTPGLVFEIRLMHK